MTKTDSKLAIEIWPIDKIIPHPKNAKIHSEKQVDTLAGLILKFGWAQPIVVDIDGVIIAGHGRRLAAIKMGLTKVPVLWRKDLSKAEADTLRLADNRVASTEYDSDILKSEIFRLDMDGVDLAFTAFDPGELDFLSSDLGAISDDAFVDDIGEAVEDQRKLNAEKTAAIDDSASPVVDALGFKRVTVTQSRDLRGYMGKLEAKTGAKGIDAILTHFAATL